MPLSLPGFTRPCQTRVRSPFVAALLSGVTALAGCMPDPLVTGDSRTDETTRRDLARKLALVSRQLGPCDAVESIDARVHPAQESTPAHPDRPPRAAPVEETWVVTLCGLPLTYRVTHARDAQGRTEYGYSLQRSLLP